MKKAIGPKLGSKYTVNPKVAKYAFVLKFPDGVVTGRAVSHALSKLPALRGRLFLQVRTLPQKLWSLPRRTAVMCLPS